LGKIVAFSFSKYVFPFYIARLRYATPGKPGLVTPEYSKSIKMLLLK
jgi:hypothetical protein